MNSYDSQYMALKDKKLKQIINKEKTVTLVASELSVSRQTTLTEDIVCLIAGGIAFSAGLYGHATKVREQLPKDDSLHLMTFELS